MQSMEEGWVCESVRELQRLSPGSGNGLVTLVTVMLASPQDSILRHRTGQASYPVGILCTARAGGG